MKASELIKMLEDCVIEHGDLDVRLNAAHGQCLMSASWAGVSHIEDDLYIAEGIHPDDLDGYDDPIKIIEIQAY